MKPHTYTEMYALETTHFWFLGKQAFIKNVMHHIGKKSLHILDMGCGTGGTTQSLTVWGSVLGVEKNPIAISLSRKRGLTVLESSIEDIPLHSQSFDVITILDVLYHKGIKENEVLQEAYRLLKPNGYLIVTDCAVSWLWNHHDEIMDAKYRYTKTQLGNLITTAGFSIRNLEYIYASIFPLFMISRIIGKYYHPTDRLPNVPHILNSFFLFLLKIEALCFPWSKPIIGSSLLCVARKTTHTN